jgi:prophage antirepressor-like protein
MGEIIPFDFNGHPIRFGRDDDGRIWAAGPDIAGAIDYAQAKDALRLVDEDEKGRQIVPTPTGDQELSVIYEEGIWELIFISRKPAAKALKKKVKEILRTIRETGRYEVDAPNDTLTWDRAAAIGRAKHNLRMSVSQFKQALKDANILRADGEPRHDYEDLFWPLAHRTEVHAAALPWLIESALLAQRRKAIAARNVQMRLELDRVARDLPPLT